jgi:hypothetical protein
MTPLPLPVKPLKALPTLLPLPVKPLKVPLPLLVTPLKALLTLLRVLLKAPLKALKLPPLPRRRLPSNRLPINGLGAGIGSVPAPFSYLGSVRRIENRHRAACCRLARKSQGAILGPGLGLTGRRARQWGAMAK